MKKIFIFLILLTLSVPAFAAGKESTYDRVLRTNTIRCGYTLYSVGLNRDAKTGQLWGIYKDVIETIGKKLNLKIEWTEEVGWGEQIEGLNAGRYDMMCSPTAVVAPRTRAADYSKPLYYSPVWIWVRANDTRFDNKGHDAINNASVKISTMDGEQTDAMASFYFPKAQKVSLPQSSDFSSLMLNVTTGKADLTFAEPLTVYEFMEKNPKSLKKIAGDKPLSLVPNIFLIPHGQFEFKEMIDNALTELFVSGIMDQAIDHYEKYPGAYVRSKGYN